VIWALIAGTRFSRDDTHLQALLHTLTHLFRTGSQTGGILNAVPVLKKITPQITGYAENVENITNFKDFFKVSHICIFHHQTFKFGRNGAKQDSRNTT
jgi:hypothetical protein